MIEKGKLKSLGKITASDIDEIIKDIKHRSDLRSQLIYVYSFREKNIENKSYIRPPRLRNPVRVHKRTRRVPPKKSFGKRNLKRIGQSRFNVSDKEVVSVNASDSIPYSEMWGIRIEGEISPIDKVFNSKEAARSFAQYLKTQGKGKKIAVIK